MNAVIFDAIFCIRVSVPIPPPPQEVSPPYLDTIHRIVSDPLFLDSSRYVTYTDTTTVTNVDNQSRMVWIGAVPPVWLRHGFIDSLGLVGDGIRHLVSVTVEV